MLHMAMLLKILSLRVCNLLVVISYFLFLREKRYLGGGADVHR